MPLRNDGSKTRTIFSVKPYNKIFKQLSLVAWILSLLASTIVEAKAPLKGRWVVEEVPNNGPEKFTVPVEIYIPVKKPKGGYSLLFALHGWNLKASEWKASGIQKWADQYGILVVCPQMGKANYERRYFAETIMKWNPVPSGLWFKQTLMAYIQKKYPISPSRKRHGLIGVSTGGHGALLLAGYYPKDFGFAAMISGDFDVSKTPQDGLAKATFGPYNKFKARWKAESAVAYMEKYAKVRIYAGHGSDDKIAPVSQARLLEETFQRAKKENPDYTFFYHEQANAGHNWNYWKSEIKAAILFFVNGF